MNETTIHNSGIKSVVSVPPRVGEDILGDNPEYLKEYVKLLKKYIRDKL
jgi:hypothetical protein